jgi:3-oxoadipate enol-lactonase
MDNVTLEGPVDGRPLVLSNALGTTSELWRLQLPALRERFRVVLYDHPPLGSVEALGHDVLQHTADLGFERFSFCGISLGGMVGMWLAANAPERVDRLVLVSTSARFGVPKEWQARAAAVRAEGMAATGRDALDKWLSPSHPARERFLRMQLEVDPADYARGLEAIGAFDFRGELHRIEAPTLVVVGADDVATTPDDAEAIVRAIPRARLVVVDAAAHLPNVEQPARFDAILVEQLA